MLRLNRWWMMFLALACAVSAGLAGCAPSAPSALAMSGTLEENETYGMPVSGGLSADVQVTEYPLVEQSTDNPNHAGFQERVPEAVTARSGFGLFHEADHTAEINKALAGFGYRLALNPSPPFSGYALYQGDRLVLRDIDRFSPILLNPDGSDFALTYETLEGQVGSVSATGVQTQGATTAPQSSLQGRLAYAGSDLATLGAAGAAPGEDLPPGVEAVFGRRTLAGSEFYFYILHEQTRLRHAGHDLPFVYDRVVHDNPPETAMYNPGANGRVGWFYALRDGLWYYVELRE